MVSAFLWLFFVWFCFWSTGGCSNYALKERGNINDPIFIIFAFLLCTPERKRVRVLVLGTGDSGCEMNKVVMVMVIGADV
jgi:hypothetical protein